MQIICLSCGKGLSVSNQRQGEKILCDGCDTMIDAISGMPAATAAEPMPGAASHSASAVSPAPETAPGTTELKVTCVCGAQLRVSASAGNTVRCHSCQRMLTFDNRATPQIADPMPVSPVPAAAVTPAFDSASLSRDYSSPAPASRYSIPASGEPTISNNAIIITAVSCLCVLILVIGTAVLWSALSEEANSRPIAESVVAESTGPMKVERTVFQEGYSMVLPTGFKQESREETEQGYIVYRFRDEDGCKITFAIIPDASIYRFTNLPNKPSEAIVEGIPELSEGLDVDVQPTRWSAGGMGAALFRYYEKETYRGVNFTYLMVVMDSGRKLVLKIGGKYGRYSEHDENIMMPRHWYDALLTFREERKVQNRRQ